MELSITTPWNELLDIASDGGLEPHIVITSTGFGSLGFEVWVDGAQPDALKAANLATELFDKNGEATRDIFEHCLNLGCVFREHRDGEVIDFRGPVVSMLEKMFSQAKESVDG